MRVVIKLQKTLKTKTSPYVSGAVANIIGAAILSFLMLFATPVLIRTLGETQYGLFRIAIISIASYTTFMASGFSIAIQRFFSNAIHRDSIREANQVLGAGYQFFGTLAVLSIIIIASTILWIPKMANVPSQYIFGFRCLLAGTGFFVAGQLLLSPLRGVFISFGRFDLNQISIILVRVILFAGGILLINIWRADLLSMTLATVFSILIAGIISYRMAKHVFPAINPDWCFYDKNMHKQILMFSGYGIMTAIGPLIVYQTQDIVISCLMAPMWVTYFAVPTILIAQLRTLMTALATPLFPIASKLKSNDDFQGIQKLNIQGVRRCLWVWGSIAAPLVIFSGDFMAAWVDPKYGEFSFIFLILLLGSFGCAIRSSPGSIITAVSNIKWLGLSQIIMAVIIVTSMIVTLRFTEWGLSGVAWSISIPMLFRDGIVIPVYTCSQIHYSIKLFYVNILGSFFIHFGLGLILSFLLSKSLQYDNLLVILILLGFLSCVIFLIGFYIYQTAHERKRFMDSAKNMISRYFKL